MLTSACWCASHFVVASTSDVGGYGRLLVRHFFWKFSLSGCVMIDNRHLSINSITVASTCPKCCAVQYQSVFQVPCPTIYSPQGIIEQCSIAARVIVSE